MEAEPHELRWPDREAGPYRLRIWFTDLEGRPAVVGLRCGADVDLTSRQQADSAYADRGRRLKSDGEGFEEIPVWNPPGTAIKSSTIRLPDHRCSRGRPNGAGKGEGPSGCSHPRSGRKTTTARQAALAEVLTRLPATSGLAAPATRRSTASGCRDLRGGGVEARRDPAKVVQYRLSDEMRRELKASTVRSWVRVAKERGYLEKPSAPRATRRPAPRTTTRSKKP